MALSHDASDLTCIRIKGHAQKIADLADAYLKRQADPTPDTGVIADMDTAADLLVAELLVASTDDLFNYNA